MQSGDDEIPIVLPDGTNGTVPRRDLSQAIGAGARLRMAADERTSGGEQFAAFGLRALNTVTVGVSDAFLASELAGGHGDGGLYVRNPTSAACGTVAGVAVWGALAWAGYRTVRKRRA